MTARLPTGLGSVGHGGRRPLRQTLPLLLCLAMLLSGCVTCIDWPGGGMVATADAATAGAACGDPQIMRITPNSQTLSSSLANPNNAIEVAFSTGNVPYWTSMVSTANVTVTLGTSRGNAVVTFQQGLTVTLSPRGGSNGFDLFLSGTITDDSTIYTLTGAYLGTFAC